MGFDRPHLAMPPDPRGTSTGRFPTLRAAAFEPAAVSTAADGGEWSATVEGWDVLAKCMAPARPASAGTAWACQGLRTLPCPHESGPRRVRRRILRARRLHPGNTESSPPHSSTRSNRECTRRTRRGAGPDRERCACTGKKSRRIGFNLNYRTPKRTEHSDETISRFGVRMHDAIHTAY